MKRYSGDPRWLSAKYAGKCSKCGESFAAGAQIFYYPNGRRALSGDCAKAAAADFAAAAADESFYCGE